jgi:ketosteroid isomerase-like protein
MLIGQDTDLIHLSVRLPPDQAGLAQFIVQQVEREGAGQSEQEPKPAEITPLPEPVRSEHAAPVPSSNPEQAIESAVSAWAQAFRSKNPAALMASYAPVVEKYYRQANVRREQIRQAIELGLAGTRTVNQYAVRDVRVVILPAGDHVARRGSATFRKTWDSSQVDGKTFSGEEIERLTFEDSVDGWKIVREEELQIFRTSRR